MDKKSLAYSGILLLALLTVGVMFNRGIVRAVLDPGHIVLTPEDQTVALDEAVTFEGSLQFPNEEAALNGVELIILQKTPASTTRVSFFLPTEFVSTTPTTTTFTVFPSPGFGIGTVTVTHVFKDVVPFDDPGNDLPGDTITGIPGGKFKGLSSVAELMYTIEWTPPNDTAFIGTYMAYLKAHVGGAGGFVAIHDSNMVNFTVTAIPARISIDDVTVNEADGTAVFTVSVNPFTLAFSVDFATADGTAISGGVDPDDDYDSNSGTLSFFVAGSKPVTVTINPDGFHEANETFDVVLSNLQAPPDVVVIADGIRTGTIVDADPQPTVDAQATVEVVEGGPGPATKAMITVTKTGATALPVTVQYDTMAGPTPFMASIDGTQAGHPESNAKGSGIFVLNASCRRPAIMSG